MKELEIQQAVILAFMTYMVILIAIVWVSYCCIVYTHTFVEKSTVLHFKII